MQNIQRQKQKSFVIMSIITLSIISAFIGAVFMKFLIGSCDIEKFNNKSTQQVATSNCEKDKQQIYEKNELLKECKNHLEECKSNSVLIKNSNSCQCDEVNKIDGQNKTKNDNQDKDVVIVINSKSVVEPKVVDDSKKKYKRTELKKKQIIRKSTTKQQKIVKKNILIKPKTEKSVKKSILIKPKTEKRRINIIVAPKNDDFNAKQEINKKEIKRLNIKVNNVETEEHEVHNNIIFEDA